MELSRVKQFGGSFTKIPRCLWNTLKRIIQIERQSVEGGEGSNRDVVIVISNRNQ